MATWILDNFYSKKRVNSKKYNLEANWDYLDLISTEDRRRGFKSSPVESVESA